MSKIIRIGTRSSQLAQWQANQVKQLLENEGHSTEIVLIDAVGDQDTSRPLHLLGTTGLFTKTLDDAMLRGEIDIAVHSLKDVPTDLHQDICQAAVLERGEIHDVLVHKGGSPEFLRDADSAATVATGSLRRKAQWLARYPKHEVVPLRGNVNTRLRKLEENDWQGAVFAKAGLNRIGLLPENHVTLKWMIPAPAQGAIMITALKADEETRRICEAINHGPTAICVEIERQFMKVLEGGCTAPIGARAKISGKKVKFKGGVFSLNGVDKVVVNEKIKLEDAYNFGEHMANKVLKKGGKALIDQIKKEIEAEQAHE